MLTWLGPLGGIILVDLVLSGDNALVIGAAASGLPRRQRLWAILCGGGGAIVLRILFAILATFLLKLPLLQAIGGVLLVVIAIRLLMERGDKLRLEASGWKAEGEKKQKSFLGALMTILLADATMSLDNVIAVGALAHGNITLLIIGLLVSIALLLAGSALIAELVGRLPWLMDVASLVLAWTAADMLLKDIRLGPVLATLPWTHIIVPAIFFAVVIVADIILWRRDAQYMQRFKK